MKIHTDILSPLDVYEAVGPIVGVYADTTRSGSRSRDHAITVKLEAEPRKGRRRVNFGTADVDRYDRPHAATWDEWGFMLAHLFALDPNLICGENYSGLDHYQWCTGKRFVGLVPSTGPILNIGEPHDQHRWKWNGKHDAGSASVCTCKAIQRATGRYRFEAVMHRKWTDRRYPIPALRIGA